MFQAEGSAYVEWIIRTDRQNQRMKVRERFGKGQRANHVISGKTLRLLVVHQKPLKVFELSTHFIARSFCLLFKNRLYRDKVEAR